MLEINVNKKRAINFEVTLSGIEASQLTGSIRFIIDSIEYGFPVEIQQGNVIAEIPPLSNIISRTIKEGENINAKLEITGNGYYLNPWNGSFVVKNPIAVEAKITENTEIKTKPKVGVKIKDSTKPTKKVKIIEDKTKPHIFEKELPITKEMILRFMSKNGTIKKEIQNLLYENALIKVGDNPKDLLKFFIFFYDKVKNSKK
jgi:hypothetical protein